MFILKLDEVYSNGEATILCEKDVELCSVFGSTCPPNSTCIEVEDTFQCECDEGYVKQGQVFNLFIIIFS